MTIDWSKAPADATHFSPAYERYTDLWAKTDGSSWMYRGMEQTKWHYGPDPEPGEKYVPRPAIWNGEGLPPVGTPVENKLHGLVVVLAHGIHRGRDLVLCQGHDTIITCTPDTLSPIPTAEQIEAQERSKACDAMFGVLMAAKLHREGNRSDICEALYDAGYRKQEQGK